jgi:hypothetical protein
LFLFSCSSFSSFFVCSQVIGIGRLLYDTPLTLEQQQYVQLINNSGHLLLTIIKSEQHTQTGREGGGQGLRRNTHAWPWGCCFGFCGASSFSDILDYSKIEGQRNEGNKQRSIRPSFGLPLAVASHTLFPSVLFPISLCVPSFSSPCSRSIEFDLLSSECGRRGGSGGDANV